MGEGFLYSELSERFKNEQGEEEGGEEGGGHTRQSLEWTTK